MSNKLKTYWNERWVKINFHHPTKTCEYAISNYGRIKSIEKMTGNERELKGSVCKRNFKSLSVILRDGERGNVNLHTFVAEHFVPRPTEEHCRVIHLDYDKLNNKWNNLKWITMEEWDEYLINKPGFLESQYKIKKNFKLNVAKVKMIKRMLKRGKTKRESIAKQFGIKPNTVYLIEREKRWSHVKLEEDEKKWLIS